MSLSSVYAAIYNVCTGCYFGTLLVSGVSHDSSSVQNVSRLKKGLKHWIRLNNQPCSNKEIKVVILNEHTSSELNVCSFAPGGFLTTETAQHRHLGN